MQPTDSDNIILAFREFLGQETYPCVAARAAMTRDQVPCLVAAHMACPADDSRILNFIYDFVALFRASDTRLHSAAIIFQGPEEATEEMFDRLLWQRLQSLSDLDSKRFPYDKRVNADPSDARYSYSLGEEAFFVIGLHAGSSRGSRRFGYPAMVFNPHVQFRQLGSGFAKMKNIVRQRDIAYSGSVNPMLSDFGEKSEVWQYSGKEYNSDWKCPLKRRTS